MIPVYQDLDQALAAMQKGDFAPHTQVPLPEIGEEDDHWARPLPLIRLDGIPPEAMNLNAEGRQTTGPVRGFGPLWLKTYNIRLTRMDISPEMVVRTWRDNFQSFWPAGTRIYSSGGKGISLGNPALLNLKMPGGLIVAAGIRVIYMDETSFSFMTVQGHLLSAWITFGASKVQGTTIVHVRALLRTSDPIMEMLLRFGGAAQEDTFWHHTLKAIAGRFGVEGYVEQENRCIDRHFQWPEARNIRYNGVMLSSFHMPVLLWRKWTGH
jgi:hypothetical protein